MARKVMTKAAFLRDVRPALRKSDLISSYASDADVFEEALAVIEWTFDDIRERGYEEALRLIRLHAEAYKQHALEEAADYFSVYG